jgi:RimJ/RimL family protein N-acetyltransferase
MRLAMRPPLPCDADWITAACQDPEIQRWTRVPVPYKRTHAEAFIGDWAGSLAVWALVDADSGDGVATAAIHRIDDGDAALGYWVAPWARRLGVATWATLELATRAGAFDGVVSASLDISDDNPASQGVARRAGFVPGSTPAGLTVPDGDGESAATRYIKWLQG